MPNTDPPPLIWSDAIGLFQAPAELRTRIDAEPRYCPWCGSFVARWGHDDNCPARG